MFLLGGGLFVCGVVNMGGRWSFLVGCIEIGDNIVNLQAY